MRRCAALGLAESAPRLDVASLSPDAKAMLAAYADGVNAWIAQRGRVRRAPEFLVFGRPQPWRITDSLLWGKLMGLWLSGNAETEFARVTLGNTHPRDKINALWPAIPGMLPEDAQIDSPSLASAGAKILIWLRVFPEPFTQPEQASNEFAVSGARTATGQAATGGRSASGASAIPACGIWCASTCRTKFWRVATAPRHASFIVIGHNSKLAWTFTTTGADVQDVFIEHAAPDGKTYAGPRRAATVSTSRRTDSCRGAIRMSCSTC